MAKKLKAKDTVMKTVRMKIDGEFRDADIKCLGVNMPTMLETQAEISFKAGIKEVVEWITEHNSSAHNAIVFIPTNEWQSGLKEWGIE